MVTNATAAVESIFRLLGFGICAGWLRSMRLLEGFPAPGELKLTWTFDLRVRLR